MPEDKVLDDLNKVFSAKRLANMVRVLVHRGFPMVAHSLFSSRNCTIQTLVNEKRFISLSSRKLQRQRNELHMCNMTAA